LLHLDDSVRSSVEIEIEHSKSGIRCHPSPRKEQEEEHSGGVSASPLTTDRCKGQETRIHNVKLT